MKRAAFFNPYLDTGGGGERYFLTAAIALSKLGWEVDVQWKDPKILRWLSERTGLETKDLRIIPDIEKGSGYNLCFWLSDGSIPFLLSKNNLLHFQTPFTNIGGGNIFNKLKLFLKINYIICNSQFTKSFIDREYGVDSIVVYPPVDIEELGYVKKEKIILSVGRFSQLQQEKRQDILVEAFIELIDKKKIPSGWQLILAGGSDVGGWEFVRALKARAGRYPIKILENLPFSEIKKLYNRSSIFWSASGFNINSLVTPHKVEHFGITVIEAMAAGCVPVVVNNGGHKETVVNNVNGFLWDKVDDLQNITLDLVSNERRRIKLGLNGKKSAEKYSERIFEEQFNKLV